jgi:hypothetical protein
MGWASDDIIPNKVTDDPRFSRSYSLEASKLKELLPLKWMTDKRSPKEFYGNQT